MVAAVGSSTQDSSCACCVCVLPGYLPSRVKIVYVLQYSLLFGVAMCVLLVRGWFRGTAFFNISRYMYF